MSDVALQQLSLDTLLQLMVDSTSELMQATEKKEHQSVIEEKKRMIDLLKKAIINKRAEHRPGSLL